MTDGENNQENLNHTSTIGSNLSNLCNSSDVSKSLNQKKLDFYYKLYVKIIEDLQSHINLLYTDYIIDADVRNYILRSLDELIKKMIKIYNENIKKIISQNPLDVDSKQDLKNDSKIVIADQKLIYETEKYIRLISSIDNSSHVQNSSDPFIVIKDIISKIICSYGINSLTVAVMILLDNQFYLDLLKKKELFDFIDKNFVCTSMCTSDLIPTATYSSEEIIVEFSDLPNISVIDCFYNIKINIGVAKKRIIFCGYFSFDSININLRTSQLCIPHIYNTKKNIELEVQKANVSDLDFIKKYLKTANYGYFLVSDHKSILKKIEDDISVYKMYCNKQFSYIMKEFVSNSIINMYQIIHVLLLGNDQCVNSATFLFSIFKDKKINGDSIANIIYKNLPYCSQIKLKKSSSLMQVEYERLKSLTADDLDIKKRLSSMANIPDSVKSYILEKHIESKSNGDNNYKAQMAMNALLSYPWKPKNFKSEFDEIRNDYIKSVDYMKNVAFNLDKTVYGHSTTKKMLLEMVAKWMQNPQSNGNVIGLSGPPGCGKTMLAKSISGALNIPFVMIPLGGANDASDLVGHNYTYSGAQYGMIVRQMIKAGNWRCVMLFDEVDKACIKNGSNEIFNILIHVTDQINNAHFQDKFFSSSIEFDLSGVLMIFSYNDPDKIDRILYDRIYEIEVKPYSIKDKILIVNDFMLGELCKNMSFDRKMISLSDESVRYIIESYTVEAGVRELKRKIETILLKLNIDRIYISGPFKKILKENNYAFDGESMGDSGTITHYIEHKHSLDDIDEERINNVFNMKFEKPLDINEKLINRYLDTPSKQPTQIHKKNMVGIINGLYATTVGIGGILPIQIMPNYIGDPSDSSEVGLIITGNQGKVMKESIQCALSVAIRILSEKHRKNININFPLGFHIHTPDGSTSKDGPSAGAAITTAFISAIIGKKISREVAMTGEIELTGKVTKIGGLFCKLTGAKKAGIKKVYLCKENEDDFFKVKKLNPELFCQITTEDVLDIKIINHIIDIVSDPTVIEGVNVSDFDSEFLKDNKNY